MRVLLKGGAELDIEAFNISILLGNPATNECIELLLEYVGDQEDIHNEQFTALHSAAFFNNPECVDMLSQRGFSVMTVNKFCKIPLHIAIEENAKKVIEILLKDKQATEMLRTSDNDGQTVLHWAAMYHNYELVNIFIDHGASVMAKEKDGKIPLHIASEKNAMKAIEILLKDKQATEMLRTSDKNERTALHLAAIHDNYEIVNLLIERGASVMAKDAIGRIPLHMAIEENAKKVIEILLKHEQINEMLDTSDKNERTALHLAAYSKNHELVNLLIEGGASVMAKDKDGKIPLHIASEKNAKKVIEILLKDKQATEMLRTSDKNERTALHLAAIHDNYEIVNLLIERGSLVMAKDAIGRIPLHIAIDYNAKRVIKILLKHKQATEMLRTSDKNERTALHLAAIHDNYELVNLLIKLGSSVMAKDAIGRIPLHIAIDYNAQKVIEILLKHEQATEMLRTSDRNERTALHLAAIHDNYEIVNLLIERGASVMAKDAIGRIPLHIAIEKNAENVIEILLKHEQATEMLRTSDKYERTALHFSAISDNYEIVNLLIERGASVMAKDAIGRIPLHIAIEENAKKVIEILLKHKQINEMFDASDKNERTALCLAAISGNYELVNLLIERGASVMAKDAIGRIPLHIAIENNAKRVIKILLKHKQATEMLRTSDKNERTALHLAANHDNYYLVNLLIERGLSVMAKDKDGKIPLHIAIEKNSEYVVKILLKHEQATEMLRTSDKNERTALHLAAISDNYKIVNILIDRGLSVMAKDKDGRIPLHWAVIKNSLNLVEILLEHEQASNMWSTPDKNGCTPSQHAKLNRFLCCADIPPKL
ncbi:serine/threonine-protein phosphatase 6 regulatory ankyrin repeat subunit B-like isoform X2 [Malaya genurostris]|uniref:serine/threonine-protein phosphatase 6 regulatory ankyrin repeat subunit B-like isoform X2 n=1 Tax=Malaya genurostris TaxID=325434 RepID=UPI0026F3B273|nr:serine/threonine-protein phosphatase 6 regulatory ankyrin repeat subunit B-like isoform X2 [Malaya genurostris]